MAPPQLDSPRPLLRLCLGGLGQAAPEADSEWNILEVRRAVAGACPFLGAVWAGAPCVLTGSAGGHPRWPGTAGWAPHLQPHSRPEEEGERGADANGDGLGDEGQRLPGRQLRRALRWSWAPSARPPRRRLMTVFVMSHSGVGQVCAPGEFPWLPWAWRWHPPPAACCLPGWRRLWCPRPGPRDSAFLP